MTSQQAVSNSFFLVHFLSKYKTFFGGVHVQNFMAFTGNFYDWIWFCWSPNWFDLFLPSDRAFYINGVRMALFFRHLNMTVCHGFSDNFGPKKGEILKRRRRDCGCRLFSDWLENREKGRRGRANPRINKRKNANFMALLFPNVIKFYIGFSAVFNWLISFQIDHWR